MGEQSVCKYCGATDDLELFQTSKGFSAIECRDGDACWQRQKSLKPLEVRRAAADATDLAALREQLARVTAERDEALGLLREALEAFDQAHMAGALRGAIRAALGQHTEVSDGQPS